jgi:16S rRNA (uracil1498-N3)-methyltransferase
VPESEVPLFFHEGDADPGATITLRDEEAGHALRSLRLKPGDEITLLDGQGRVTTARLLKSSSKKLDVQILSSSMEPPPSGPAIWLGAAVVRGPRFDFVIEKATELGVAGFIPILTRHSVVRTTEDSAGRTGRWKRIAIAAMKQSLRVHLPEIRPPTDLEAAIRDPMFDQVWVAEPGPVLGPVPTPDPGKALLLLVGPEGGWHPSEAEILKTRGASLITLGDKRLRSETAAMTLLVAARCADGGIGLTS